MHNRVETIEEVAGRLRSVVPGVRFAVAHGQMPERVLEGVMQRFLDGEADVLVTTTIVESGLDIATANTLIVERADTMGLAQLYQLRGRIGRSTEQAYAYLFAPLGRRRRLSGGLRPSWTSRSSAAASRWPCGIWRSGAPGTCSAPSSRGT